MGSGVEIYGLELEGAGNSAYNQLGIGVEIKGAWDSDSQAIRHVQNIKIEDCYIHDFGGHGIYAEYSKNINIVSSKIERIGYAGIGGMSVSNMHISKTKIKGLSPGTGGNAYGVYFSRKKTSPNLTEIPRSENCSAIECVVEDNLIWEALDTHGGQSINFINNTIKNCKTGIAIVGAENVDSSVIYAAKDCKIHGNTIYGNGTGMGIVVKGGGSVVGTASEHADRISIVGNSVTGSGVKGNAIGGGIQLYFTRGATVVGNTLLNCTPHGIVLYHTNEGFAVQGNTVIDPQDTTITIASGIVVRNEYQTGVISGNSLIKTKASTENLFVAMRGIYLTTQTGIDVFIGANYSNFERPTSDVEGQGVRFNSLMGNSGAAMYAGLGTPEGKITAIMGSIYINRGGGAGTTFYIKESGSGNTGWIAK